MISSSGFALQYNPIAQQETYRLSTLHVTSPNHYVGVAQRDNYHQILSQQQRNIPYTRKMPPGLKRSPSHPVDSPAGKQVKTEHPEEFSNAVKKRLASSTRTGQACDRCKVRKIRCDGLPGGCSSCLQNNTECRTTDRITGRATSRGYVEGLEQQNRELQQRLHEAEQRLAQGGLGGKPNDGYTPSGGGSGYGYNNSASVAPVWNSPERFRSQSSKPTAAQETNMFKALPAYRPASFGDNYLGVSAGNSNLSSIKGTALSILGMEIDVADFKSMDMDEPDPASGPHRLYNKSYQAFLQSALGIQPSIEHVDLPPREEGLQTAGWYIRLINPYTPVLHGPTFMTLLIRMYDDPSFQASAAQTAMVHAVFASMCFQNACRNFESEAQQSALNERSNMHYHYALSKFYQLSCSHTVQDVQALTLICMHLRNFPKPGASWILCQTTMSIAIELGLHRSSKRWATDAKPNILDVEMRKRIFWGLLTIHITLSGKLGRPMPIRSEDMDVEFPEAYDDELLSENGLDTSKRGTCTHLIGLQAFRIVPIMMELYGTIYAVRREPETYMATVTRLEAKLRAWKDAIPSKWVNLETVDPQDRIHSLLITNWELEFVLLLRHPSVSMTTDAAFNAQSLDMSAGASRKMLEVVLELQKMKCLDTTWYNTAVYVLAITTTLFSQWEKRGTTSASDLAALEFDMNKWLGIMGEVGNLLGSGSRLREAVRTVTNSTISLLHRSMPTRTEYAPAPNSSGKASSSEEPRPASNYANMTTNYYESSSSSGNPLPTAGYSSNHMTHSQTPYPAATQYSNYAEPSMSYRSGEPSHAYNAYQSNPDEAGAPLLGAFAAQAQSQSSNQAQSWQRNSHPADAGNIATAWHQYTDTVSGSNAMGSQDGFPASALMSLGRQSGPNSQANAALSVLAMNAQNMEQGEHQMEQLGTWPLNLFAMNHGGSMPEEHFRE